jgi:hypothetical protein
MNSHGRKEIEQIVLIVKTVKFPIKVRKLMTPILVLRASMICTTWNLKNSLKTSRISLQKAQKNVKNKSMLKFYGISGA